MASDQPRPLGLVSTRRNFRIALSALLALLLVWATVIVVHSFLVPQRRYATAYFDNSNGIFVGDEIRILGVPVGEISAIEPEPLRAKITFWYDARYKVPADVKALILSPQLITARAIQLAPAYRGGSLLPDHATIPQDRTAVPVEWDDLRQQLQKLSDALQPTTPGGTSPLGSLITSTANNLRGQGENIRQSIIELSSTMSALSDHRDDIFGTIKNLSVLTSALSSSSDLMRQLNENLASVTALLANDPNEIGAAVDDVNTAIGDVKGFLTTNRESLGVLSDKAASITTAIGQSLDDLKQTLHVAPNAFGNFVNIYEPAHGSMTGIVSANQFSNPIGFLCGAIQAASRMNAEQSAKLCVQYLAPIIKNRQYNFLPIGLNPISGATARPNEITYSEDWMRPDYRPSSPPPPADVPAGPPPPDSAAAPLPAEAPAAVAGADALPNPRPSMVTDPSQGLPGMMLPPGTGS